MRAQRDPREAFLTALASQITDARVLEAFAAVDRSIFVLPEHAEDAWRNDPLPIGKHQTISQPMLVATMCELLRIGGHERVLDVGTGSGYHAALLGRLGGRVISIERHASLAERARRNLDAAGSDNVTVVVGDGSRGYSADAPYDAINVAAAAPGRARERLARELAKGGRMVAPTAGGDQRLVLLRRSSQDLLETDHGEVRFVPLVDEGE